MTLDELRSLTMQQLQEDVEDIDEYQPMIDEYINMGYMQVMNHLDATGTEDLSDPTHEPAFYPEQYHGILADYATYGVLGTGTTVRQSRAMFFYNRFLMLMQKCHLLDADGNPIGPGFKGRKITNKYNV